MVVASVPPTGVVSAQSVAQFSRQAYEECASVLDESDAASVTYPPVLLPSGEYATMTCRNTKRGITISIRVAHKGRKHG
jgi:hypothetical protein